MNENKAGFTAILPRDQASSLRKIAEEVRLAEAFVAFASEYDRRFKRLHSIPDEVKQQHFFKRITK